ncbi:MAG TPA: acetyltransferase [Acidobacteriota bacterium]|nr:acetyltransferase [Acidobacteriota bacterium]
MLQKKKLIIFGTGEFAEVVEYYFRSDSDRQIVGFVVDNNYFQKDSFCGLPVSPMTELVARWPFSDHEIFIAIGYSGLNRVRGEKAIQLSSSGYSLASFVSSKAVVATNVKIGSNCFVLEHNTIQPFVTIGNNVVLWSGNHVGHHTTIEKSCFITSHVVISGGVRIGEETFVGVNAAIRDHVSVGRRNIVGAGALILQDTPDDAVFVAEATPMSKISSQRMVRFLAKK